jgi:hypothetical protein
MSAGGAFLDPADVRRRRIPPDPKGGRTVLQLAALDLAYRQAVAGAKLAFGRLPGATVRFTSVGGTSFRCDFSRKSVLPALQLVVFQAKYEQPQNQVLG